MMVKSFASAGGLASWSAGIWAAAAVPRRMADKARRFAMRIISPLEAAGITATGGAD